MTRYTPFVTLGIYLVLIGIGASLVGSPSHNLWSVRYLWQTTNHPLTMLLPPNASGDGVPVDHRSGRVWQARALLTTGQPLQAEAILQPALLQGEYDAQRLQAEILAARGNVASAVQLWAQVGAVDDILVAARQASQRGQHNDALMAYRAAYTLAPERTALPFAQFLRQNTKDVTAAETLLRQYIAAMPSSPYFVNWLRELGMLYREQQAWTKAQTIYMQIVAALPGSVTDWVELGWIYYERSNDAEKAMTQFQQAISVAPQEGDGYYAIGSILSREKHYQEAEQWFAQAVAREPMQEWWWLGRANAQVQSGNLSAGIQTYTLIEQRFPDFAEGYYQAAWAYKLANDKTQAVKAIETALQRLEQSSGNSAPGAHYYFRAGQIYEWVGNLSKAVTFYKAAAQLDPQRADIQDALGRLQ